MSLNTCILPSPALTLRVTNRNKFLSAAYQNALQLRKIIIIIIIFLLLIYLFVIFMCLQVQYLHC